MKKPGFFAASVAAASATAVSTSSSATFQFSCQEAAPKVDRENSCGQEKFAPKFDGLRFIETLITAHR